jgi:hypothetical protein
MSSTSINLYDKYAMQSPKQVSIYKSLKDRHCAGDFCKVVILGKGYFTG